MVSPWPSTGAGWEDNSVNFYVKTIRELSMMLLTEKTTPKTTIGEKRERYLAYSPNLMVVVIDFNDGPQPQPDPPHSHPHEQITYVDEGELLYFIDGTAHQMTKGDLMVVPPGIPHTIQVISRHVRLVDSFNPVRNDFL
jgi:quercetin dioxygenase-like cupin family protein